MKLLILPFLALLLAACSLPVRDHQLAGEQGSQGKATAPALTTAPTVPAAALPAQAALPNVELTPELLYRLLLAEIAGQRARTNEAAGLYLDIARETRDPRIARRATEIALHGRRLDEALQSARLWVELEPASPAARQAFINLLAANERYDEMASVVAALLAVEPHHLRQNLLHLNRLFARSRDRSAVHRIIEQVTAPYLALAEAHYARAVAAHEARDMPAAITAIDQALEIRPDWEMAALVRAQIDRNRARAIEGLGRFVDDNPQAREARLAYARLLTGEQRYKEALREFRRLLDPARPGSPPDNDVVFAVAALSLQLGDKAEAERLFRQLIDSGYADADKVRLYLGQIAADAKRWDEAQRWFGAVGPGEHFVTARLQFAAALLDQGEPERARALMAATRESEPRLAVRLFLGEAQLLRERKRYAEAHTLLSDALKTRPDEPDLLYEAALLAERLDRIDELERHLRHLIEIRPDHAHAHNALGYTFADRNIRLDEARRLIARALELAPNDPYILDSEGWVLYRLGDKEGALRHLQRAYDIRPDAEIAAHLGEVLWMLGRQDEARAIWDKARRSQPDNEVLIETLQRLLP